MKDNNKKKVYIYMAVVRPKYFTSPTFFDFRVSNEQK